MVVAGLPEVGLLEGLPEVDLLVANVLLLGVLGVVTNMVLENQEVVDAH